MFILADIGGTNVRVARSQSLENFSEPVIFHTPENHIEFMRKFTSVIENVAGDEAIDAIALGKPIWTHRWPNFREDLADALDVPSIIENDTALVGLGEVHFGAGQGSNICMYVTVSTGVNGARIVDGSIDRSTYGFEIGGQFINADDTLENLVSGTSVKERFGVASPKDLGAEHPVWDELAAILAYGVHNTILHWSPDRVVFGGSMFNTIGIKVERVEANVRELMHKFPEVPEMAHSQLGDLGGLYGAMVRLRQALQE
jgi:predicted NBD/HSP70 family sugar kinase